MVRTSGLELKIEFFSDRSPLGQQPIRIFVRHGEVGQRHFDEFRIGARPRGSLRFLNQRLGHTPAYNFSLGTTEKPRVLGDRQGFLQAARSRGFLSYAYCHNGSVQHKTIPVVAHSDWLRGKQSPR